MQAQPNPEEPAAVKRRPECTGCGVFHNHHLFGDPSPHCTGPPDDPDHGVEGQAAGFVVKEGKKEDSLLLQKLSQGDTESEFIDNFSSLSLLDKDPYPGPNGNARLPDEETEQATIVEQELELRELHLKEELLKTQLLQ